MSSSIEWLLEQLDISQGYESAIKILEQAKEMHKQEMIDAVNQMPEISDEDIKRKIKREYLYSNYNEKILMIEGAIWYKEQLKKIK
jgi:DNA-directed RNA polymerase delta subunit